MPLGYLPGDRQRGCGALVRSPRDPLCAVGRPRTARQPAGASFGGVDSVRDPWAGALVCIVPLVPRTTTENVSSTQTRPMSARAVRGPQSTESPRALRGSGCSAVPCGAPRCFAGLRVLCGALRCLAVLRGASGALRCFAVLLCVASGALRCSVVLCGALRCCAGLRVLCGALRCLRYAAQPIIMGKGSFGCPPSARVCGACS